MNFSGVMLLGGLAFFIYGVRLARIGLQEISEDRLRGWVQMATQHRLMALTVGIMLTAVLQSSSATTVMLVGFANNGLITLVQAMGVILGADIGTTLTVQLISLHFADWSLLFVIVGILLGLIGRKSNLFRIGNAVLGFGFIFYGMNLMGTATIPLRSSPDFQQVLLLIGKEPVISLIGAAFFTILVQSSAVTIGLALSLAQVGVMNLEIAIPMVLGANIGTCAPALAAGMGGDQKGKQVAYAHLAFKILGTLIIFPLLPEFAWLCRSATHWFFSGSTSVAREVANAHTIFNIGVSLLFLPFVQPAARLIQHLFPEKPVLATDQFKSRFLDENALDTPALAQGCVTQEILRSAEIVHAMMRDCFALYEHPSDALIEKIEEEDDRVDYLDREIRFYLAKIAQRQLTKEQAARQLQLLNITTNLESMGDIINRDFVKLARKLQRKSYSFSKEGLEEIRDFYSKVNENFALALAAFSDRNPELARKVLRHERILGDLESTLKQNHLARLQAGLKESFDTSSIHLELLGELRRVNTLLTVLATAVLNRSEAG